MGLTFGGSMKLLPRGKGSLIKTVYLVSGAAAVTVGLLMAASGGRPDGVWLGCLIR